MRPLLGEDSSAISRNAIIQTLCAAAAESSCGSIKVTAARDRSTECAEIATAPERKSHLKRSTENH